MKNLRKKIYITAGYNTISLGTGRKEFHPKKPRPGIENYIKEAGEATLKMIGGGKNVDECVIGNFISARFNNQAHLNAFFPMIDENLRNKPAVSVESACASGGQALQSGIKSILAETADVVLVMGVEVQNTVKAIYGADILAGAGWFKERKEGQAYFFPGQFSNRAGAYYEKFGKDKTRKAMAKWFCNAIENARLCPTAQEFHNKTDDLEKLGMMEPVAAKFTPHLNVFDCSKVSDGASSLVVLSEEGLERTGVSKSDCIEVASWAQSVDDITKQPDDLTQLSTMRNSISKALKNAGITINDVATAETHDCFTIAGILSVEAMGLAEHGKGADYVLEGNTTREGKFPINTTGGLIGWGHPTGATGVHMAVTILEQLTGKAGDSQINIPDNKPYALSVNMGGDDKTLVSLVYKKTE